MTVAAVESGTKRPPGVQPPEGLTDTGIGGIGMAEPTHVKLCECGCGEPAPLAKVTNKRQGAIKGQPQRFVLGHHGRSPDVRRKISVRRAAVGNEALRGRKRPPEVGAKVSASKRGIPNPDRQPPRDGDKIQARRRVRLLVRLGYLPRASDLPCTDCGQRWVEGEAWFGYDHYLGYDAEHHEHVEPVCIPCHNARERKRVSS